ncbi:MAG: hypothetical protein H0T44_06455 [Gemmatimonadales bacterium]|nr:hypothetical protein [Gemmatimonadales bacterium]
MRSIEVRDSSVSTCGTDLSLGMLREAPVHLRSTVPIVAADAVALPFRSAAFTVVVSTRELAVSLRLTYRVAGH